MTRMTVLATTAFLIFCTLAKADQQEVKIPINIGIGPAFHQIYSPVQERQQTIFGMELDLGAIITHEMIEKNKDKLPEKYRNAVMTLDEARIGVLFIPRKIFISPLYNGTEVYGADWEPLEVSSGIQLGSHAKLMLGLPLRITYLYINDLTHHRVTNFIRPGTGLNLNFTAKFSDTWLVSFKGGTTYYIPQELDDQKSIYRMDHVAAVLHYRWPYTAKF